MTTGATDGSGSGELVGVALVPSAPVLVEGVSPVRPEGMDAVGEAADGALAELVHAELVVLVAAAPDPAATTPAPDSPLAATAPFPAGVHQTARAGLGSLGLPDVGSDLPVPARAVATIAAATELPRLRGPLPVDLAVLALRLRPARPVVPVAVDSTAEAAELRKVGTELAAAAEDLGRRVGLVAAGEGSAGLDERAPRHVIEGAKEWEDRLVSALADFDIDGLARLGPQEAGRVAARGWASTLVAAAAAGASGRSLSLRRHAAPRGLGYAIAVG
ncbi:hypothetical protein ER308_18055 [Egibacter rhizosphaerae]|uniref:Extradiol ring-cleavage dioxygenase class III enzyme subunit B domain-containing protein n=1 Tax=Egibacter rhizosphaerae TaxID=1670831 RepID=A0A411YJK0_9ACTN|nr:hypothetical protein [Egibacter rhizosphaerae]QBI21286.1 hypothetical protein ER308_18055 [Egibacter rhizosphaerae]